MPRKFFVGGNFKMNPRSPEENERLINFFNGSVLDPHTEVVIAPPSLFLIPTLENIRKDVKIAAQNCYFQSDGAYTGEISATQLYNSGIEYVILGHSERRRLFHETSEFVAQKTRAALDCDLNVILCVGETLEEREAGRAQNVVESQLQAIVAITKDPEHWSHIVVAYEPVWAIGTGKIATSAQVQETHVGIRRYLATAVSHDVAESTRIIYGGSVNANNCKGLASQPDVDGFLVGGASLKPEFVDIVNVRVA
ncbi:triose phosphate isomerase [Artomyces pyxidatus]|uniref:Triose phosphate isomerase n=1 Tax=Artomyces pyxidatus TaxID=48021 RepID=A0ACB8SJV9_9AGAM|nr:triose phosphate isomerase [Artomyces pyxidatus]